MTDKAVIINASRKGYSTDQIEKSMTVLQLIGFLAKFDPDSRVLIGNDRTEYGWYTYGGITARDIEEHDEDKEDYDEDSDEELEG